MTPDGEPINNPEAAKRAEVSRVKMIINHKGVGHLLTLPHDPDFPTVFDEEKEVVGSFKMQGVNTIDDLFNRTQAPGYSPEKAKEVLDIVSTAVAEVIMESGHTQVLVAGSASTEKFLSIAWLGHDRKNENSPSFAFMVAEKFRERIGAGETRNAITSAMEYLDFIKNSDYAKNGGLEEEASRTEECLSRIRPNVLNKGEMKAYAELRQYVLSLQSKNIGARNGEIAAAAGKLAAAAEKISVAASSTTSTSRESNEVRGGRRPKYSPEGKFEGYESDYELKKNNFADALKDMQDAYSIRWNDYLTTSWYENLSKDEKGMVSLMAMISGIAGNLKNEKDLERILGSKETFSFISEHMNVLFNHDFKMVMSKMLNDLGEIYTDQNGWKCFRYKEIQSKDGSGRDLHPDVKYRIEHIRDYEEQLAYFLAECNGRWAVYENDEKGVDGNILHKRGEYIMEDGKRVPDWLDRSMAYTAWNMFFGFGDSSVADRLRILPTLGGIISDQIRTLNPESKALGKWQALLKGKPISINSIERSLKKTELFSGKLGKRVVDVLKMEWRYGVANGKKGEYPIDGKKTLRQKIVDGDMRFMSHKMFYGFFDFVNGSRDLYKVDSDGRILVDKNGKELNFFDNENNAGEKVTLGSLLYDYAFKESKDPVTGKPEKDSKGSKVRTMKSSEEIKPTFSFGSKQVTFMNEYRDSMEGAILAYMNLTGKADIKDPKDWIMKFVDKLGMVNGISFSGREAFSYSSDPLFWRDVLIGAYGCDSERLSTSYFCLKMPELKQGEKKKPYNLFLYDLLTKDLGFSNYDFDLNELMKLLGVTLGSGQDPAGPKATTINELKEKGDKDFTGVFNDLLRKAELKHGRVVVDANKSQISPDEMIREVESLNGSSYDFKRVKADFKKAIDRGLFDMAEDLLCELRVLMSD